MARSDARHVRGPCTQRRTSSTGSTAAGSKRGMSRHRRREADAVRRTTTSSSSSSAAASRLWSEGQVRGGHVAIFTRGTERRVMSKPPVATVPEDATAHVIRDAHADPPANKPHQPTAKGCKLRIASRGDILLFQLRQPRVKVDVVVQLVRNCRSGMKNKAMKVKTQEPKKHQSFFLLAPAHPLLPSHTDADAVVHGLTHLQVVCTGRDILEQLWRHDLGVLRQQRAVEALCCGLLKRRWRRVHAARQQRRHSFFSAVHTVYAIEQQRGEGAASVP